MWFKMFREDSVVAYLLRFRLGNRDPDVLAQDYKRHNFKVRQLTIWFRF